MTGRPGQSRDVGDRLSCVLGITAKLTSRNRSAHLRRIKFNILEPKKLYAYVKSVQLCQVHVHLSHSNLILCLMKIFRRAVSSPSIRVGQPGSPAALNSRSFGSEMAGKLRNVVRHQRLRQHVGCVHHASY